MTDFSKDLDTFYDKVGMEIRALNKKDTLNRDEIKAGFDAICLMHKIKHFENDGEKYGWNEDGYSQKGWALTELPSRNMYPYAYADQPRRNMGNSNGYPMYGNSYNMGGRGYSRTDGVDDMVRKLNGLSDQDRMAAAEYIDRLMS